MRDWDRELKKQVQRDKETETVRWRDRFRQKEKHEKKGIDTRGQNDRESGT